ncbi:MAG: HU family DNA-binding protein [Puniceicoccales bacterium]|jgi:nucleoid DNA-binding protein|nr:HU family DNA-binding protein [Puniceicoccales bacterium]
MIASKLTKRDIVLAVSAGSDVNHADIAALVQGVLDCIVRALESGKTVELRNFGVFEIQIRKARIGRNPNKPSVSIHIPKQAVVKFKTGKTLREKLKKIKLP